jgi:hypothetical protein
MRLRYFRRFHAGGLILRMLLFLSTGLAQPAMALDIGADDGADPFLSVMPARPSAAPTPTSAPGLHAESDGEFAQIAYLSLQLWTMGVVRPAAPMLDPESRDVTAVQAQLDQWVASKGLRKRSVRSAGDRAFVEAAFIAAQREAIRRVLASGQMEAGVYRMNCLDFGYGGVASHNNLLSAIDLQTQIIVAPGPTHFMIALNGQTRLTALPVVKAGDAPHQPRVPHDWTLQDAQGHLFQIQFRDGGLRLELSNGGASDYHRCPFKGG